MPAGKWMIAASLAALCAPTAAWAQETPEETPESNEVPAAETPGGPAATKGAQIYDLDFFARFAPQTALEMVERVPGFTIVGQDEQRGLGQGGANVLLNGERFSAKSTDIFTALRRIGAANVIRVELLDAASLDVPGLSGQVVNLVYRSSSGNGQFRWSPSFRSRGTKAQFLDGEISYSGKLGGIDYTVSLENDSFRNGNNGLETVTDAGGAIIDLRDEILIVDGDRPKISGTLKREASNGNVANLNLAYERYYFDLREDGDRIADFRTLIDTEDEYNYEIGGDYEFGVIGGRLKLIGLHRFEHSPFFTDVLTTFDDGSPPVGFRQARNIDETESIVRGEFGWKGGSNDWQVAAEGAYNKLETDAELSQLDDMGVYVPIPLPGSNTTVDEKRAEVNLTWGRPIASNLTLQASLGGEYSRISQSGPSGLTRSFIRPKGFVSTAWKASETLNVRLRLEREVGQLNFFDFVATADINNNNQNASNPELVPQQSWDLELEATKTLGAWGSITLSGDYRLIQDIVGQVPIGDDAEAPGNLDGTRVFGVRGQGTLRFDPIGWKGGQLEFDLRYRRARLDDPLTGERIPVSENLRYEINLDLRHDIPRSDWAYGGGYFTFAQEPGVRLNQLSQFTFDNGEAYVFVENKDVFGLRVRAQVGNLTGTGEDFKRIVFVNRRTGPIAFTEDRKRSFGQVFSFEISGSF